MLKKLLVGLGAALSLSVGSTAFAGTIVLEGSDASTFHAGSAGGAEYLTQLFSYLKSDSSFNTKPVFVLGDRMHGAPAGTVDSTTLLPLFDGTGAALYSAVYVQSPGGCCNERPVSAADQAAIAAFVAAGGSVAIQDYQGGLAGILGFDAPQEKIGGYNVPGGAGGPGCFDTQVFLPTALSKGFVQPPALGCWGHQAYDMSYFGDVLGFVSLVDSGREFAALGSGRWSSFLALGGELGSPVPVPGTALLVGLALLGLGLSRRRA